MSFRNREHSNRFLYLRALIATVIIVAGLLTLRVTGIMERQRDLPMEVVEHELGAAGSSAELPELPEPVQESAAE